MNWNKVIPELVWRSNVRPLYRLTNEEMVAKYATFKDMKAQHEAKCHQLKQLLDESLTEIRQEAFDIDRMSDITEVYEGVALKCKMEQHSDGRRFFEGRTVAECPTPASFGWFTWRDARVWAHYDNYNKFGLELSEGSFPRRTMSLYGQKRTIFNDFDEVIAAAKNWLAKGILP